MRRLTKAQFDFEWIFAIVAGAAILVLAIYGAIKLGNLAGTETSAECAKQISIITDPLQAGFASGSFGSIKFNQNTRIDNFCSNDGLFGKNAISCSLNAKTGWTSGPETSIYNKYIFSSLQEGKNFYVFSKPFSFPYKVSDLIFLSSQNYCFINPPVDIKDEITGINAPNIIIDNCTSSSIRVCFEKVCDIGVFGTCNSNCNTKYDEGYVLKNNSIRLDYAGSLMYGAVFSDKDVYECNVKRLLYRASKIAEIYSQKSVLMNARDCGTNIQPDLVMFSGLLNNATSDDLIYLSQAAKQIQNKVNIEDCKIW